MKTTELATLLERYERHVADAATLENTLKGARATRDAFRGQLYEANANLASSKKKMDELWSYITLLEQAIPLKTLKGIAPRPAPWREEPQF